ncbi:hypothetical protein M422DRAFT_778263 [Sphaerobolus stellatus SS14]|uniref:Dyp-type peroxidase C-terminal domain-containing protein n=1 Tax=Sphaerobolus stellatus (strain SS14) TaxID=990650 RepID=A0A0C9VID8_SPHS4|nr:hypothetical protein M422DRAFT_778263 [Sphaerobolus stellatus SS14]
MNIVIGYRDGISQPYINIEDEPSAALPGQMVINPGVLVQGKAGDPKAEDSAVQRPNYGLSRNGSILVYRHLKQLVPEFDTFLHDTVVASLPIITHPQSAQLDDEIQKRADYLGARLVGRWKSGLPVVFTPKEGNDFPVDDRETGSDPQRNNDFIFDKVNDQLDQSKCPFAAHIRKTTPRNDIPAANGERSAILRAGIPYGPEVTPDERQAKKTSYERGLSFVCYQSALSPGFVFMQKVWCNNQTFIVPKAGFDPIVGQALKDTPNPTRFMTGWDADKLESDLTFSQEFVISQGGEYFFSPSMTVLKAISRV